ncbi:enoyl-CoA hydratase [soil metagenome]
MSQNLVTVRIADHGGSPVAYVTVNRSEKRNAFSSPLMAEFMAAFASLDRSVRAVVLTGAGKAFIGGADVSELASLDKSTARAFIERVHGCCAAIRDCRAPVIARINGYVLGAGLEVAAACDMRVAADGAVFGMPEVRLGIPSVIEAALLPQLIGWGRTRELLLTGDTLDAAEALRIGLVERIAPLEGLDSVVTLWLGSIVAGGAEAIATQKALIRRWEELPMASAIEAGVDAFEASWNTDEPARMMAAFQAARRK